MTATKGRHGHADNEEGSHYYPLPRLLFFNVVAHRSCLNMPSHHDLHRPVCCPPSGRCPHYVGRSIRFARRFWVRDWSNHGLSLWMTDEVSSPDDDTIIYRIFVHIYRILYITVRCKVKC